MPSWNIKVPTDGGPVSFLNIFDSQEAVRIPLEARMGDQGTYRYEMGVYRWQQGSET